VNTEEQTFQEAVARHQAGQLQEAERLYRSVLQTRPNHAEANHNLGMIAVQSKQAAAGLTHFKSAIQSDPNQGRFRLSYVYALLQAGQPEAARRALGDGLLLGLDADAVAMLAGELANHEGNADLARQESSLAAMFEEGRFDRASAGAARMTKRFPLHGKGWMALGMARASMGNTAEAVGPFRAAATLMPGDFEAHLNLAVALKDVGRFAEAEASSRRSVALRPDVAEAHGILGSILQALGRQADAEASLREALRLAPQLAEMHCNLGVSLQALGRPAEAEAAFRRALEIDAGYALAHANLGGTLVELGRFEEAKASVQRSLEIAPESTLSLNVFASLLVAEGDVLQAMQVVLRSLAAGETEDARRIFVNCARRLRFTSEDKDFRTLLIRALAESWARPAELATVSVTLIKLNLVNGNAATLGGDPLLCALLNATPVCDVEMERVLTMARAAMLEAAVAAMPAEREAGPAMGFYCALANQCFINEYVFSFSEDEHRKALGLRRELERLLDGESPIPAMLVLAVAAYWPLGSLANASRLLDKQWPEDLAAVLQVQIREPMEESRLRPAIARLTAIDDDVSRRVQSQYEENPYPRWVRPEVAAKSQNLFEFLRRKFPFATLQGEVAGSGTDILVAGCGTGQHSIETSRMYTGARVLAIDLSMNSLAYAKRKSDELGIAAVEYAQADLLRLGGLDRSFDLIESVGVLHHLADPWEGWRVLLSLLRPGGIMRLGFYSEIARRHIVRARAFIAEKQYGSTAEEIRRCRQELLGPGIDAGLRSVTTLPDFFSTSECRDLLFHVQEHRVTLPQIGAFLRDQRLEFVGMDIGDEERRAYRARFPGERAADDLGKWHEFEKENPDTFIGMYQFWVQKPD
jgi:tetratricopeptide (TPR) repeat protein/2-polyprenyl-3-methyl-5-hydroxy-6-metoxy-1,4-benzoquinol methylase